MEFDGERIARRGIVVVTVNYRLGALGFLCHPEITKEAPDAPANFGHLDQQAGTRWVKRNIAAFGGDPENITIGGQSAGGGSVLSQLVSPQNKDFCQKAIIESGVFTQIYPDTIMPLQRYNLSQAEKEGEKFFDFLGVSSLEEARKLDALYIRDKALEYNKFWCTVVDDKFSVGEPIKLFIEDKRLNVPVILGRTSSEFMSIPNVNSIDEFKEMARKMFGDDADEFISICGADSNNIEEVKSKATASVVEFAIRIMGKANSESGINTPLYYYNFDAEIPGWDNPGTFHSVDLWFFFETLAKCWRPFVGKHYDLARQMCNYWCYFIKNGDPNGKDSTGEDMPQWNTYSVEEPYGMLFGDKAEFLKEEPNDLMKFLVKQFFKANEIVSKK